MELRDYQQGAIRATLELIEDGKHPVISVATGGGKSLIIAELCKNLMGRILICSHVQELLVQNMGELLRLDASQDAGIYSAGLGQRKTGSRIVFGGIQSIHAKMDAMQEIGPFKYIIVDECHLVTPGDSDAKMYNTIFQACPGAQRIGLSATPYRLTDGLVYGDAPCWFDSLACDYGIRQLTPQYLAPLRGVLTASDMPIDGVRSRMGDFVLGDLSQMANDEALVEKALDEICFLAAKRKQWLIFCVDVAHSELVAERLRKRNISTGVITGATPKEERAQTIESFRNGTLRALANCQVLTTGFNVPGVDAVVLMRPTQSKGLLVQCLGRGTRQAAGKKDCVVIDLAGNIERHAPLDAVYDIHRSPKRVELDTEKKRKAEEKKMRELKHTDRASDLDPMDEDISTVTAGVEGVFYSAEPSKNPRYAGKSMVKVLYKLNHEHVKWCALFLCCEYGGYAAQMAQPWFTRRGCGMPDRADVVVAHGKARMYRNPEEVVMRRDGRFWKIVQEHFQE